MITTFNYEYLEKKHNDLITRITIASSEEPIASHFY